MSVTSRGAAYWQEVTSCGQLGARWRDKINLIGTTLGFHAWKKPAAKSAPRVFRLLGPGGPFNLHLRPHTGDLFIFHEVFTFGAYRLPTPLKERRIRTVVDLGANIGLASLFLYGEVRPDVLVAVEPIAGNCTLLRKNLSGLQGRIIVEEAAVGATPGVATLDDASAPTWGATFTTGRPGAKGVRQTTIPELIETHGLDRIGLLKMDIEGAEANIFSADCEWLNLVDLLIIELHSDDARRYFDAATTARGFRRLESQPGASIIVAAPTVES